MKDVIHLMRLLSIVARNRRTQTPIDIIEIAELPESTLDTLSQDLVPIVTALHYFQKHELGTSPSHLSEIDKLLLRLQHLHPEVETTPTTTLLEISSEKGFTPEQGQLVVLSQVYRLGLSRND